SRLCNIGRLITPPSEESLVRHQSARFTSGKRVTAGSPRIPFGVSGMWLASGKLFRSSTRARTRLMVGSIVQTDSLEATHLFKGWLQVMSPTLQPLGRTSMLLEARGPENQNAPSRLGGGLAHHCIAVSANKPFRARLHRPPSLGSAR